LVIYENSKYIEIPEEDNQDNQDNNEELNNHSFDPYDSQYIIENVSDEDDN
jgi:hypothetical protein